MHASFASPLPPASPCASFCISLTSCSWSASGTRCIIYDTPSCKCCKSHKEHIPPLKIGSEIIPLVIPPWVNRFEAFLKRTQEVFVDLFVLAVFLSAVFIVLGTVGGVVYDQTDIIDDSLSYIDSYIDFDLSKFCTECIVYVTSPVVFGWILLTFVVNVVEMSFSTGVIVVILSCALLFLTAVPVLTVFYILRQICIWLLTM